MYIPQRNGIYYFRMVVPKRCRDSIGKTEIIESLRTRDQRLAMKKSGERQTYYLNLIDSEDSSSDVNFAIVKEKAKKLNIDYKPDSDLLSFEAEDLIDELSGRMEILQTVKNPGKSESATLGGTIAPGLSFDSLFSRYQELCAGKWADLDHRARQKKWYRYRQPIDDFIEKVGNLDVLTITPRQASDYAVQLGRLIENGKLKAETAKKKLIFLNAICEKVFQVDFPGKLSPFVAAKIDYEGDKSTRKPFSEDEIRLINDEIAKTDSSPELKAILDVLEWTGCHAKEIALLTADDIRLDHPVPHIKIRPNENRKSLKTGGARIREIPLLDAALDAFKQFPAGFPTYCRSGGSEALSAAANKQIKAILGKDCGKTTYSYRHRIADLLRNHPDIKDSATQAIMGHNGGITARYGDGFTLESKRDTMARAFSEENRKTLQIERS